MTARYRDGIPIHRAIIVRHTPRDHSQAVGSRNTGAIPMSSQSVSLGLDYIGREGEYQNRSDIEREATAYDDALVRDRLDYIGRLGDYVAKGLGRQEDATYWDQHGPVARDQVEASMRASGGAFVDSIVTVKREHMEALGLSTKEDMQRLLRCTWQRNVEKWGAIRNPEDIRWVACYHTDAARSVHAHIYTWSARGEIQPGYTVSREGTRAGKEKIYRVGYARIREERNIRRNHIRDLSRFEARRQLGLPVSQADARRLEQTALRYGLEYRLSDRSDLSAVGQAKATKLLDAMRSSLDGGHGHLAHNWKAYGIARDLVRLLEKESPSFAHLSGEYRRCAEVLADLKGYGDSGFARERDALIRGERDEFLKRVSSKIVRGVAGDDDRFRNGRSWTSRSAERAVGRAARRPLIAFGSRPSRDAVSRAYGVSIRQVRGMERDYKAVRAAVRRAGSVDAFTGRAMAAARSYAERAASGSALGASLREAAQEQAQRTGAPVRDTYEQVHGRFVDAFARNVTERAMQDVERSADHDRQPGAELLGILSVLESASRSMAYCAVRGGMRGERDRSLDHDRFDVERALR